MLYREAHSQMSKGTLVYFLCYNALRCLAGSDCQENENDPGQALPLCSV